MAIANNALFGSGELKLSLLMEQTSNQRKITLKLHCVKIRTTTGINSSYFWTFAKVYRHNFQKRLRNDFIFI